MECHRTVGNIGRGGQFIEGKPRDAVHQDMVFITPVKFVAFLIVLVGSGMDAKGTLRVAFWVILRFEFTFCK